ncbi:MAG TPA: hypothetical protein VHN14_01000 [Kofleriaceae bacterium]|nr:hypothetical protein [Kofleriaceae bacterium]
MTSIACASNAKGLLPRADKVVAASIVIELAANAQTFELPEASGMHANPGGFPLPSVSIDTSVVTSMLLAIWVGHAETWKLYVESAIVQHAEEAVVPSVLDASTSGSPVACAVL